MLAVFLSYIAVGCLVLARGQESRQPIREYCKENNIPVSVFVVFFVSTWPVLFIEDLER